MNVFQRNDPDAQVKSFTSKRCKNAALTEVWHPSDIDPTFPGYGSVSFGWMNLESRAFLWRVSLNG